MSDLTRLKLTGAQQDTLALLAVERADMRKVRDIYAQLTGTRRPSLVTDVYIAEGQHYQHYLCYTIRFVDSQTAAPHNYYGGALTCRIVEFHVESTLEWLQRGVHRDTGVWAATVERYTDGGDNG